MSYDPSDDDLLYLAFPAYDPYEAVHIGTVIEDEPECHGTCHESCCAPHAPCSCLEPDCEACGR